MTNNLFYSNTVDVILSNQRYEPSKPFIWIGEKIDNIKDPFEFEFKKKYGYIDKNSIRCSNGDIYTNVQIIE